MLQSAQIKKLNSLSALLRLDLLSLVSKNGGHIGGSLSCMDILISLYFGKIFKFPKSYDFSKDAFILSAGHLAPALYTVLAHYGTFPRKELSRYSHFGSPLEGHVSTKTPGVLFSSGALGQGLSFAIGLALAKPKNQIVCLTSDGEHQEGQIWESIISANKYRLGNIINIVDYNKYQIDGSTEDIMPLEDLGRKYLSFGWTVYELDGHDHKQIQKYLEKAKKSKYPVCLLAHTTLGKGVSFMHHDYHYHDVKTISEEDLQKAYKSLKNQYDH